jgi:hypothetical protein
VVSEAPGMHWRWWRICRINILWFKKTSVECQRETEMLKGGLNTLYFDYLVSLYAVTMMGNIRNGPNIRFITTSGQWTMALLRDDDQKAIAPPLSRKAEHVPLELSSRGESVAWREMRWWRMAICMGSKRMLRTRRAGARVKGDGSR